MKFFLIILPEVVVKQPIGATDSYTYCDATIYRGYLKFKSIDTSGNKIISLTY